MSRRLTSPSREYRGKILFNRESVFHTNPCGPLLTAERVSFAASLAQIDSSSRWRRFRVEDYLSLRVCLLNLDTGAAGPFCTTSSA